MAKGKKKRPPRNMAVPTPEIARLMMRGAVIQERQRMIAIITHDMTTVMLMVLHDKFEFEREKLDAMLEHLTDLWEAVIGQYVSCEDLENCLFEETGLDRRVKRASKKTPPEGSQSLDGINDHPTPENAPEDAYEAAEGIVDGEPQTDGTEKEGSDDHAEG